MLEHIGKGGAAGLEIYQPVFSPPGSAIQRRAAPNHPAQNWVLSPTQDFLLIIAAPLLSLALAVLAMNYLGAGRGAALVITVHVILTVAHHLPTFIRIYGDVELFQRHKWSFVLGPVLPLLFSIGVITYRGFNFEVHSAYAALAAILFRISFSGVEKLSVFRGRALS